MFEPEVNDALQHLTEQLSEQLPEVGEVLAKVRAGEMREVEAIASLMSLVGDKGLGADIERIAESALGTLKDDHNALTVPLEGETAPAVVEAENGVKMLNPLVEAAIAERAQFDGDVPELRSGPLIEGVKPAVPVDTSSRNPVAIGVMLNQAADEVEQEIIQDRQEHARYVEGRALDVNTQLEAGEIEESTALETIKNLPPIPTGVKGYEAGKVPALREVEEPDGSYLAQMSSEEQQQAAWKVLSTTQGRRSALRGIEELMLVGLVEEGYEMASRAPKRTKDVPIHAEWSVNISGQAGTQTNFSFIDVAARSLLRQLVKQIKEKGLPDNPVLELQPVNTVDIRQVGWAARIVSE